MKPNVQDLENLARLSVSQSVLLASSPNLAKRIGFFGSLTERRNICYLVDCSGSMRGVFRRVRKELKESVGNLQQDQYFYIIFFGGGRLIEFGNGRLFRATEKAKFSACDFIDSVKPAGQTNALERVMQIRDSGWHCCQLCDGH